MAMLISPFEVPVEADERFVAGWTDSAEATLHRALRADVDFRFVVVSAGAVPSGGEFASHPARYEVVHEDGSPDGDGGVVLINPFEVPDGADAEFLAAWDGAREALAGRRGYLGTRLHRSPGPADFRFVNIARWSSPLMFAQAIERPEFHEAAQAMPFASHPALYTVVRRNR
jgi:heme-degrading monooxygenase HmoA